MKSAAIHDADVADFATRATDWLTYLFAALEEAPSGFFDLGCGW